MNMDQTKDESNSCAQCSEADQIAEQFCDQVEDAMNHQLELCMAALFILGHSDRLIQLENEPELMALHGIVAAIGERAKVILQEVETSAFDKDVQGAFGGQTA